MLVEFHDNVGAKTKRDSDDNKSYSLKDILDNDEYRSAGGRLPVPIGITEIGHIIWDLGSIQHILIC